MRFTPERVNEASGDPNYLTESCLYRDQDESEQDSDDVEVVVPKKFTFNFPQEGKYSELEFAGMANPIIDNAEYDLEKETGVLTLDTGATTTLSNTLFNSHVQQCSVKISLAAEECL